VIEDFGSFQISCSAKDFPGRTSPEKAEKKKLESSQFSKEKSSSFPHKGRILQGPFLLEMTSTVFNDPMSTVFKRLDEKKM